MRERRTREKKNAVRKEMREGERILGQGTARYPVGQLKEEKIKMVREVKVKNTEINNLLHFLFYVLSFYLSVCLSICILYSCLNLCVSVCLSICILYSCPYLYLSVCLYICVLYSCLYLYLSVCQYIYLSLSIYTSLYLCVLLQNIQLNTHDSKLLQ